jgi:hypothetical protein
MLGKRGNERAEQLMRDAVENGMECGVRLLESCHDKQNNGKSFMPQESFRTNRYRGKSHVRPITGQ